MVKRLSNEVTLEIITLCDDSDIYVLNYQEEGVEPNQRIYLDELEVTNFITEVEQYIRRKNYLKIL